MLRCWVRICQRGNDNVADYLKLVSRPHPWGDKELKIRLLHTMIEEPTIKVILRPHLSTPPVVIEVALIAGSYQPMTDNTPEHCSMYLPKAEKSRYDVQQKRHGTG